VPQSVWPKPVRFTVEFGANYLWHLLAVARVGYVSPYASKCPNTVAPADVELIAACKDDLAWVEDSGGNLSGFFVNLPAWLKLESHGDFEVYFETMETALHEGSLQPFVNRFPGSRWKDPHYKHYLQQANFASELATHRAMARRLAGAYMRNLEAYRRLVWPRAAQNLKPRELALAAEFAEVDFIARWESLLDIRFAMPCYEFLLCYASQGGPDFNSVGYGRTVMYYDKPFKRTCQFASHEIGTHLLFEVYSELLKDSGCDKRKAYCALEILAQYCNRRVLEVETLEYHLPGMDENFFLERFEAGFRAGKHPRDLLRSVL